MAKPSAWSSPNRTRLREVLRNDPSGISIRPRFSSRDSYRNSDLTDDLRLRGWTQLSPALRSSGSGIQGGCSGYSSAPPSGWRLEAGSSSRQRDPRQVVGDIQRSAVERAGRKDRGFQSVAQGCIRDLPASNIGGSGGPLAILPYGKRRSIVYEHPS